MRQLYVCSYPRKTTTPRDQLEIDLFPIFFSTGAKEQTEVTNTALLFIRHIPVSGAHVNEEEGKILENLIERSYKIIFSMNLNQSIKGVNPSHL